MTTPSHGDDTRAAATLLSHSNGPGDDVRAAQTFKRPATPGDEVDS
ncbi:hypothetical protein [Herbidospora sp. RD11066]